jgi:hypothetical protein
MTDDPPFYSPNRPALRPQPRQPGERVWQLSRDGHTQTCELHDDTKAGAGWDVMVLEDGEPLFSRRCVDEPARDALPRASRVTFFEPVARNRSNLTTIARDLTPTHISPTLPNVPDVIPWEDYSRHTNPTSTIHSLTAYRFRRTFNSIPCVRPARRLLDPNGSHISLTCRRRV